MSIDTRQNRFVMNMQQTMFCQSQALSDGKKPDKTWLFLFSKKAKCFEKSQNFNQNLASKKPNWQHCA